MNIFYLPPRLIDTSTLLNELSVVVKTFHQIDNLDGVPVDDRIVRKYQNYHPYIFARHELIVKELRKRDISITDTSEELLDKLNYGFLYPDLKVDDISKDVSILTAIWSQYDDEPEIMVLNEELNLLDYEEIINEVVFDLSQIREEFDLSDGPRE